MEAGAEMFGQKPDQSGMHESYFLAADFFKAFSNPAALIILEFVRKERMTSPQQIAKRLGMGPQAIFALLNAMERKGVLVSHATAQNTFYCVDPRTASALDRILELPRRKMKRASTPPRA